MKKLKRRIRIFMMALLDIIFISIFFIIIWQGYNLDMRSLRENMRANIYSIGQKKFYKEDRLEEAREYMDYCTTKITKDGEIVVVANFIDGISDEKLIEYTERQRYEKVRTRNYPDLLCVKLHTRNRDKGRIYVFTENDYFEEKGIQFLVVLGIIFIGGLFLVFVLSVVISGWIVVPLEKNIAAEKEFISNASHELKTPIAIISACVELLAGEIKENVQLEHIRHEVSKMNELVGKMLIITRLDTDAIEVEYEEFDLSDAIMDIVLPFESVAFEKDIVFDIEDIQENIMVYGNREQLQRAVSVLIDNAFEYVEIPGTIEVSAGVRNKKEIFITVADTGEQIAEDKRKRLFDRFYRDDEARQNSGNHFGLGLSIAHKIIKKHGGDIDITYNNGKNIFIVKLPLKNR